MLSNVDVTVTFLRHPDSRIFHIHIQPGAPPPTPATSHKFTKIRKVRRLHLAGHTLLPCLADLHAPRIPIRAMFPYVSADPHTTFKLQKSRHWFRRNQRFRPRKPGTRRSPQIPCADCRRGTACPDGAPNPPRPAASLRGSTHPTDLLKFPAPTRGAWASGYGVASRCDDGVAATSTTVGPAPACVIGLSGLGARLQSSLKA